MSSRHSSRSTERQNSSASVSGRNKGSLRSSRTTPVEPLDDQLTDWWSSTVLGSDSPFVSDDSASSLGWEFTMEDLPTTANVVDSQEKGSSDSTEVFLYFDDSSASKHKKKQADDEQAAEN